MRRFLDARAERAAGRARAKAAQRACMLSTDGAPTYACRESDLVVNEN